MGLEREAPLGVGLDVVDGFPKDASVLIRITDNTGLKAILFSPYVVI